MKKEANLQIRRSKVVEQLARSGFSKRGSGFDLDHQLVIDNHVETLRCELQPFVEDYGSELPSHSMASREQLPFEGQRVHVLEEAVSKGVVHVIKASNYRRAELLFDQAALTPSHDRVCG
jgi:hypothetical protein